MKSPGNDLKVQLDLAAAFKIMNQRRRGYEDGKAYYDGDVAEMAAGNRQVARILQRSAEAHKLTFANIPVDALFDKIALATISSDGAGKEFLANIMDDADLLDEASDWNIKAGYFGDYYVVLDADEQDDNGEDDDGIPLPGAIKSWRPIGSSPLSTVAVYSPKDQSEVLYFVKRWQIGDHWEACVYYDDATVAMQTGLNTKNQGDNSKVYVPSRSPSTSQWTANLTENRFTAAPTVPRTRSIRFTRPTSPPSKLSAFLCATASRIRKRPWRTMTSRKTSAATV
jgi:hypothetical protein